MANKTLRIAAGGGAALVLGVSMLAAVPADAALTRFIFEGTIPDDDPLSTVDNEAQQRLNFQFGGTYAGYFEFDSDRINDSNQAQGTFRPVENGYQIGPADAYQVMLGDYTFDSVVYPGLDPEVFLAGTHINQNGVEVVDDSEPQVIGVYNLTDPVFIDGEYLHIDFQPPQWNQNPFPGGVTAVTRPDPIVYFGDSRDLFSPTFPAITLGALYEVDRVCVDTAENCGDGGDPVPGPVPVPAALPLFASALGLFGVFGWRRRGNSV